MFSSYKNMKDLWRLNTEPYDKEIVFLEDENAYFIWSNNIWQPYDDFAKDIKVLDSGINFYEMNKQIISQLKPMDNDEVIKKASMVTEFITEQNNTFYMLYGKEISYFTVFQKSENSNEYLFDILVECLMSIGNTIYSIDLTEDSSAIEIWVEAEGQPTVLYLFAYDGGIVPFGG